MLNNYIDLNFDVLHSVTGNGYVDGNDIRLVDLSPIAFFSNFKLTKSSGKHVEDIGHAYIVSLLYELITSARDTDDLSFGFDRSRDRRQQDLTKNKTQKGIFHLGIYL